MTEHLFDIIVPVGRNEIESIQRQIEYTKKNIIGFRNIYIVTPFKDLAISGCTVIDERIFPFSLKTVEEKHGSPLRAGWYLQQIIKIYCGFVIPGILDKYLIIDADTYFLKPTRFIEGGKCLYNPGTEYHTPYFEHMKRVHPSLYRVNPLMSGICHHMIMETKYVKDLIEIVESCHNGKKFWEVFLDMVQPRDILGSGASEYEMYFNFMLIYYPEKIRVRPLGWANLPTIEDNGIYDYVSVHWYLRK